MEALTKSGDGEGVVDAAIEIEDHLCREILCRGRRVGRLLLQAAEVDQQLLQIDLDQLPAAQGSIGEGIEPIGFHIIGGGGFMNNTGDQGAQGMGEGDPQILESFHGRGTAGERNNKDMAILPPISFGKMKGVGSVEEKISRSGFESFLAVLSMDCPIINIDHLPKGMGFSNKAVFRFEFIIMDGN